VTEDRLVGQKEAAKILAMSVSHLKRQTWVPKVPRPTSGRKRKVTYVYRYSTLMRLIAEMEQRAS
jgi:hypothetical protein